MNIPLTDAMCEALGHELALVLRHYFPDIRTRPSLTLGEGLSAVTLQPDCDPALRTGILQSVFGISDVRRAFRAVHVNGATKYVAGYFHCEAAKDPFEGQEGPFTVEVSTRE